MQCPLFPHLFIQLQGSPVTKSKIENEHSVKLFLTAIERIKAIDLKIHNRVNECNGKTII